MVTEVFSEAEGASHGEISRDGTKGAGPMRTRRRIARLGTGLKTRGSGSWALKQAGRPLNRYLDPSAPGESELSK